MNKESSETAKTEAGELKGLGDWFERKTREGGEKFVTLRDGRPEWLQEAVREAHGGTLPNDWIHEACKTACDAIDEGNFGKVDGNADDDGDAIHDFADSNVEVYTVERFRWATEVCLTEVFAEAEEDAESLAGDETSIADRLGTIQFCALEHIARIMVESWRESAHLDEEGGTARIVEESGDDDKEPS